MYLSIFLQHSHIQGGKEVHCKLIRHTGCKVSNFIYGYMVSSRFHTPKCVSCVKKLCHIWITDTIYLHILLLSKPCNKLILQKPSSSVTWPKRIPTKWYNLLTKHIWYQQRDCMTKGNEETSILFATWKHNCFTVVMQILSTTTGNKTRNKTGSSSHQKHSGEYTAKPFLYRWAANQSHHTHQCRQYSSLIKKQSKSSE